ncbi:MAG TPA: glycosyltransferase family 4 protein, partial [Acidimicrobiales bacterium]|nr:glycosyltransferase family 4 protein [Acidimicrobiales bacterium]
MRILYLCADRGIPLLGAKGASVHVRAISSALQARGHDVTVACARTGSGNPPPEVEQVVELARAGPGDISPLVAATGAEAVVERYSLCATAGLEAARAAGVPLVVEVNAPLVWEAARYRGFTDIAAGLAAETALFEGATAVPTVSRALQRYVSSVAPATPVHWVPNGVDPDRFHTPPAAVPGVGPDATVVGFVGSMKPWHGVADLLAAFGQLAASYPGLHLVVAGSGPEEGPVRDAVPAALAARVHLLGALPHSDIPGLVARFDIAVAPYRPSEDFYFCPLKVLEYLAAGRPVVYPELGDMPELVGPGGEPFAPGDVGAMAEAIGRRAGRPEDRARMGRAARQSGARWTWDRAAADVE